MLQFLPGGSRDFLVSRAGPGPLRAFLKRHGLQGSQKIAIGPLVIYAIKGQARALQGLPRTTWREIHTSGLAEAFEIITPAGGRSYRPNPHREELRLERQRGEILASVLRRLP